MKKSLCLLALAALALTITAKGLEASAQQKDRPRGPNAPREQHTIESLKQKVDLPGLPSYTGKCKFVSGFVEPQAKGGPRYTLNFEAVEPRPQVLSWYSNALRMYDWREESKTDSAIVAYHKDGHLVNIQAVKNLLVDGRENCRFTIHFKIAER